MAEALDTEDLRLAVYAEFVAGRRPLVADLATSLACRCPPSMRGWPASPRSATSRWAPMARSRWPTRSQRCRWVSSVMGTDRLWWGVGARGTPSPSLTCSPTRRRCWSRPPCPSCGRAHAWRVGTEAPPEGAPDGAPSSSAARCGTTSCGRAATSGSSAARSASETGSTNGHERGYVMDLTTLWRLASGWYAGRLDRGYAPGAGRRDRLPARRRALGSLGDCEAR